MNVGCSNEVGLAQLKPVFRMGGSVTAGNSSQMSDGAGAVLLASEHAIKAYGLTPIARFVGFAVGSLLLGMPFTAITLFAVREARRLRGNAAAGLIGYATASYGVGQILGPLFAAPLAQRTAKKLLNDTEDSTLAIAIELEGHCYSRLRQSEDFKEGVEAFNKKRPPKFIGR